MLISQSSIELFFNRNGLKLVEERDISDEEILKLYDDAKEFGSSFISFVHFTIVNPDTNKLYTNFDSFEEVYIFYNEFMIGLSGNKNN